jgi:chromate transporter
MSGGDIKSSGNKSNKNSVFDVFRTFLLLGLTSFGGPVAHLGYFRKELIEKQKWVSENQYAQLLTICQFIPGPASSQVGFSLGLIRAGWLGALAAFVAFTFPSVILLIAFVSLLPLLSAEVAGVIIHGLKLVACAVVADAVWGMFKKLCPDLKRRLITLLVIVTLLLLNSVWAQLLVIAIGAALGMLFIRQTVTESDSNIQVNYSTRFALWLLALFVILLFGLPLIADNQDLLVIAQTFYHAGAFVFGGGHVVLPLLQESVVTTGMVSNEAFLAGYGASQAIPGPMFAFAAYLGALISTEHSIYLTALTALLFMFLPGFLLIAAALPLWQKIANNHVASNAISGINAAVVGLLAVVLYDPIFTTSVTSVTDLFIASVGFIILTVFKRSPLLVIVWCLAASGITAFF